MALRTPRTCCHGCASDGICQLLRRWNACTAVEVPRSCASIPAPWLKRVSAAWHAWTALHGATCTYIYVHACMHSDMHTMACICNPTTRTLHCMPRPPCPVEVFIQWFQRHKAPQRPDSLHAPIAEQDVEHLLDSNVLQSTMHLLVLVRAQRILEQQQQQPAQQQGSTNVSAASGTAGSGGNINPKASLNGAYAAMRVSASGAALAPGPAQAAAAAVTAASAAGSTIDMRLRGIHGPAGLEGLMAALLADTFDGVVVLLPLHDTVVKCVHILVQAALEDIIPARHHFRCVGVSVTAVATLLQHEPVGAWMAAA